MKSDVTKRRGDKIFTAITASSGIFVLVLMASIGLFLFARSLPAFSNNTSNFFTEVVWFPDQDQPKFGIAALTFGTITAALIAMFIAVPVAIGTALFISFYAPKKLAGFMAFIVDLLAAVPSIIFGIWGLQFLMPKMVGVTRWIDENLGFIPVFENRTDLYSKSLFVAGVVLAIMILPTIGAISREVFKQVPNSHIEASLALGSTRWEMIKMAVLPYARSGMISAAMLGLGRALGETIAVALILSSLFDINIHITEPGGTTFAANIALKWNEAGPNGLSALIASGLVLFIITLAVNSVARAVIARRKEFSE